MILLAAAIWSEGEFVRSGVQTMKFVLCAACLRTQKSCLSAVVLNATPPSISTAHFPPFQFAPRSHGSARHVSKTAKNRREISNSQLFTMFRQIKQEQKEQEQKEQEQKSQEGEKKDEEKKEGQEGEKSEEQKKKEEQAAQQKAEEGKDPKDQKQKLINKVDEEEGKDKSEENNDD
jgi:Skp family chaperone for outer membrane proteins